MDWSRGLAIGLAVGAFLSCGDGCCPAGCTEATDTDCRSGPDLTPPTIGITSPIDNQKVTTATIPVSGVASDDVAVTKVEVKVGAGAYEFASGTAAWNKTVMLSVGSNTIFARATDSSGNQDETSVVVTHNEAAPCGNGVVDAGEACDTKGNVDCASPIPICRYDCQACVAPSIVINPDKTISINGKKTFVVGMSGICAQYVPATSCTENLTVNSNSILDITGGGSSDYTISTMMPAYGVMNQFFSKPSWSGIDSTIRESSSFFGYIQPDEATAGEGRYKDMSEAQMLADLQNVYDDKHTSDPAHPVILNHWTKMTQWLDFGDIMMWDTYTITYHSWQPWTREDSIYAWEIASWNSYFQGTELNEIQKPVWTYIQANIDDPNWSGYEPTKQEARANTYAAITLDVKGIEYFGYLVMGDWWHLETCTGVYQNQTLADYYNQLMGELRGLNDVLVLPTADYGWTYHPGTNVTFSKNFKKNVYWKDTTNFNWMLKRDGTKTYLIIVNKDANPITEVEVAVAGLSGSMTASTLGLETLGSQRAGRTLPVNIGKFTDSFDGYAVHIYEIAP